MYAIGALSLAVAAISSALLGWRLIRTSRRDRFVAGFLFLPIAFLILLILLIQGIDAFGGGEFLTSLFTCSRAPESSEQGDRVHDGVVEIKPEITVGLGD